MSRLQALTSGNRPLSLATQIAERILVPRYEDIAPAALDWTASAFVDTVGVTLAGIREDPPQILLRVPGVATAGGPALIIGTDRRTSVLDAALVNGTASHALDYDDVAASLGGHPSAMLVPALIPLGEMLGSSGRDLVLAYVVGFDKRHAASPAACTIIITTRAGIPPPPSASSAQSPVPPPCSA